jgi:hypothetical protein
MIFPGIAAALALPGINPCRHGKAYSSPTLRFSLRFSRLRLFFSHFQRMRPFFFHFLGLDPNKSPNEKCLFVSGIFILQYL